MLWLCVHLPLLALDALAWAKDEGGPAPTPSPTPSRTPAARPGPTPTHSPAGSPTHSLTHSLTHSSAGSPTHPSTPAQAPATPAASPGTALAPSSKITAPSPGSDPPAYAWEARRQGQPVAEGSRGGRRIVCCVAPAARAQGVQPGQRLSTAQALAPDLPGLPRQPRREAELLQRLALALGELTPQISLAGPDLLLEIQASLRLFGGVRRLLRRARHIAQGQGCRPLIALAATPLAARLLAHQGAACSRPPARSLRLASTRRHLAALPLDLLAQVLPPEQLPSAQLDFLLSLGLRRLGELVAPADHGRPAGLFDRDTPTGPRPTLPRSGLARRGGRELLAALDRAWGEAPEPLDWFVPPEQPQFELTLGWRADHAGALVEALRRLLPPLCGWLALRWRAAQALDLELRHERRHGQRLAAASADRSRLAGPQRRLPAPPPSSSPLRSELSAPSSAPAVPSLPAAARTPDSPAGPAAVRTARLPALPTAPDAAPDPEDGTDAEPVTRLVLELASPSRSAEHLLTLLGERLQRLALPAPVYALRLTLRASLPLAGQPGRLLPQGSAADPAEQAADLAGLIDRLRARLGADQVLRLHAQADARPERASVLRPAGGSAFTGTALPAQPDAASPTGAVPRPTWLLPSPARLACDAHGRPLWQGRPLQLLSRAERIESGWFDEHLVRRDYHLALAEGGLLCWVFRRHPQLGLSASRPTEGMGDTPTNASAPATLPTPGASSGALRPSAPALAATGPSWYLHGWFG